MAADSPEKFPDGEAGGDFGDEGDNDELRQLSDRELQEKAQRIKDFGGSLPDGGEKLRRMLGAVHRELARRQAARSAQSLPSCRPPPPPPHGRHRGPDDDSCERIIQSRCAESSGLPRDANTKNGLMKSDFLSAFQMAEEADIDVSQMEIANTRPGKHKTLVKKWKLCEEELPCRPATQTTDLSHEESYIDNSINVGNMSADDACKDNTHIRIYEDAPTPSRKRKGASPITFSMQLRSKKEEVVLLDVDSRHSESAEKMLSEWDATKIYYPSREHHDSVELSRDDIKCLEPESLLSSPIMNFYIMYLQGPMSSISRVRGNYHIFNTYFFSKLEALTSKVDKAAYFLKLRRWWKGVDIFQMAYILLPVHADAHWSLVIICMPSKEDKSGPIVLHLDSLKFHSSRLIFSVVDRFLKEEWHYLNKNCSSIEFPLQEMVWKNLPRKVEKKQIVVPQQENEFDCGLFVLYYMQRFIEEAPERFHKKYFSMFGEGWFRPEEASALRKIMLTLLLQFFEEAKANNNTTERTARSENPLEGSSANTTSSEHPLESTLTEPTTLEHPLECR